MQNNRELILKNAKNNISSFLRTLPSKMDSSECFTFGQIDCSYSGFKTNFLNSIVGGDLFDDNFEENASVVLSFLKQKGASCVWWLNYPKELQLDIVSKTLSKFDRFGFKQAVIHKGMILSMDEFEPAKRVLMDFEISLVEDELSFIDFAQIYTFFAENTARTEASKFFALAIKNHSYRSRNVKYFVGYHNKVPVCIGSICFSDDIAGIYDAMTLPSARHNGFATALTSKILREIKEAGARFCVLQSSLEAINIYTSFGFEVFENYFIMYN
jgi:ribosomal protein S18 acetylase RimI-like enzyme